MTSVPSNQPSKHLKATREDMDHLDSGYSWIVAFAATMVAFFQLGLVKAFSVFVPELVDQLGMSASAVGLSCSIGIGLRGVLGPVWSALTRIASYRQLVFTGGVVSSLGLIFVSFSESPVHLGCSMAFLSIGSGLPSVAKVLAIKDYFDQRFGLANGIAFTGGAVGMAFLPPILERLIETYGWRGAMLIFGAMNFHICLAGALMVQPCKTTKESSVTKENNNSHLQRNSSKSGRRRPKYLSKHMAQTFGFSVLNQHRVLIVYLIAMALHELVLSGWALFLVSYTISSGYSLKIASFLSALGGGGALAGRLLLGPLMDKGLITGPTMFLWLAVGGALTMLLYPFVNSYWMLALVSFVAGGSLGSATPVFVVMLNEVVGQDSPGFAAAVGLHYMTRGIGMLTGGPITGWVYDISGNFYLSFITLAVLETVVAIMTLATLLSFICNKGTQP